MPIPKAFVSTLTLAMFLFSPLLPALPQSPPGAPSSCLVRNLQAGKPQTVAAFGTSLTRGGAWVGELQKALNARWPGQARVPGALKRCLPDGIHPSAAGCREVVTPQLLRSLGVDRP